MKDPDESATATALRALIYGASSTLLWALAVMINPACAPDYRNNDDDTTPADDDADDDSDDDTQDDDSACDDDTSGDDDTQDPIPQVVLGRIAASSYHSCALDADGYPTCWGCSQAAVDVGQCMAPERPLIQVVATSTASCGLDLDGDAVCWGQLRDGSSGEHPGPFTMIAAGDRVACGVLDDGEPQCWGCEAIDPEPCQVEPGPFVTIAVGDGGKCGLRPDGTVSCWGNSTHGITEAPAESMVQVSLGPHHGCGLKASDGLAACWGYNNNDQATPPMGVSGSYIASGAVHTCLVHEDGSIGCWGCGQPNDDPGLCIELTDDTYAQVATGSDHACAMTHSGGVSCWGGNDYGQSDVP